MDVYLINFLLGVGPLLCFYGIGFPALVTTIAYRILRAWIGKSKKKVSTNLINVVLVMIFIFAAIVSWSLIFVFFRQFPIVLD
jgi:hypothetical protein